jgi:YidC/Oxa1 family membrane protein insertase
MKNKNILSIGLLIAFIFLYSEFVVKPYQKKHSPQVSPQVNVVPSSPESASNSAPTDPSVTNLGSTQIQNVQQSFVSESERTQAAILNIGDKRSISTFPSGAIGSAEIGDYKTRDNKSSIVLLKDGLKWSSTDKDVQGCLNSMRDLGNHLEFSSQSSPSSSAAYCSLKYVPSPTKKGVISTQITLKGFNNSKGFLELRGVDRLGLSNPQDHPTFEYLLDGSKKVIRDKELFQLQTPVQGKISWVAWGDRYFATLILPRGNFNPNVIHGAVDFNVPYSAKDNPQLYFGVQYPLNLGDGTQIVDLDLFFTARDTNLMAPIQADLEQAVELGWFPSIARALIFALNLINKGVGNYGIAIIILTLLARAAFWPLNKKVFQSGQRMKALQPEMERIKAKYGSDRSKMNEMNLEVMGLYKKHGVNPMGACLPMLLQLPIWFGLYQALNHSIDLYQAPFYGWISDLSAPDPFYIFPIAWTISLIAYIYINPTPQQPGQPDMKWMMFAMNLFIGWMSKDWPSGLTLYLFVSNLVGITQQLLMQRAGTKLQPIKEGV